MLKTLNIKSFKSIFDWEIELGWLTLLTGTNSSGKSSIIQAIRMIHKASTGTDYSDSIFIDWLGSVRELKNKASTEDMTFRIKDTDENEIMIACDHLDRWTKESKGKLRMKNLIHVSADRYGPRLFMPIFSERTRANELGIHGENIFQCLENRWSEKLNDKLRHPNSEWNTLEFNLKWWLSVISPWTELDYNLNKPSDISTYSINWHRPTNVWHGISYALPVIMALLMGTLEGGSIVVIENPEAHVHPRWQAEIARLIALCAEAWAQIIIETHSDHIFDWIRIYAKSNPTFQEKAKIYWLEIDGEQKTAITPIELSKDGRIKHWPKWFFDQFEINAIELLS